MKKILIVLSFILSFASSFGQSIVQRSTAAVTAQDARLYAALNLGLPRYQDTIQANLSLGIDSCGTIIFTYSGNNLWKRACSPKHWELINNSSQSDQGTRLVSGNATWSGSGLTYDVTACTYYILGNFYSSAATPLTLTAADPTYPRKDVIYVGINGVVGILTGVASLSPIKPVINPLTQIELTFVDIDPGATTPTGVTNTIIYDENGVLEWGPSSNVASVNFSYPTNPLSPGSVSTYVPNATNGQYVRYTNGTTLNITSYQYLKFYVRLNAALSATGQNFLTISFYNSSTQVTQNFYVSNGNYGFNASTLNAYQLIVIPIYPIQAIDPPIFDNVNFYINGAPTSFQLDQISLQGGTNPSPVLSNVWRTDLNSGTGANPLRFGTSTPHPINFYANGINVLNMPAGGLQENVDTVFRLMLYDPISKNWYLSNTSGSSKIVYAIYPIQVLDSSDGFQYVFADTGRNVSQLVTGGTLTLVADSLAALIKSPGGSNREIQYNNAGSFGGATSMTYNPANAYGVMEMETTDASKDVLTVLGNNTSTGIFSVRDQSNPSLGTYFRVSPNTGFMRGSWLISGSGNLTIATSDLSLANIFFLNNVGSGNAKYGLAVSDRNKFAINDVTHSLTRLLIDSLGNVGIGTGTATLDSLFTVKNGGLRFDNGRAQAGYVWTSTGTNGGGDWKPASGGGSTGWDDMLAQNQAQTVDRAAELNNNTFRIWHDAVAGSEFLSASGGLASIYSASGVGFQITADSIRHIQGNTSSDTAAFKPIGMSSTGGEVRMNHWPVGSGGSVTTDSVKIGNDWFYTKKVAVTSTQLLGAVSTTGVELIPSPGSGKAVEIISASEYLVFNTTAYTQPLPLTLVNVSGETGYVDNQQVLTNNINSGSTFMQQSFTGHPFDENAPILLFCNDNITDGDSDITIYLYYRIISL